MSLLEVICVIGVALILGALLLAALAPANTRASRVHCVYNLKNVGLAFRIFAADNNDLFPFQIPVEKGGSLELTNDVIAQLRILSNELSTPKILICPTRSVPQIYATNWLSLQSSNISYYVSLTTSSSQTNSILSGDAGFTYNGAVATNGIAALATNARVQYPKPFHLKSDVANLCRSDGSVEQFNSSGFPSKLKSTPYLTNLFVMP